MSTMQGRVRSLVQTGSESLASVPLSHLSVEVGHFYMNELTGDQGPIRAQFKAVKQRLDANLEAIRAEIGPRAKVSTCLLIDDYFRRDTNPSRIIPSLLEAAQGCGLSIDYLAREEGCSESPEYVDGMATGIRIPLAEMLAARIMPVPVANTTGQRPSTIESGWLSNGRRSSEHTALQAMRSADYILPEENGRRDQSILIDTQLWTTGKSGAQLWSCPYLASIWQLLRLGALRHEGAAVVEPQWWRPDDEWPQSWRDLPTVIQLDPDAAPFAAYRTLSILPHRFLGVEHAVEHILGHLEIDAQVIEQTVWRGAADAVTVPSAVIERIEHIFISGSW